MNREPREVWVERVRQLAESRLTAAQFAAEHGVNAHTLCGWRWRLSQQARRSGPASTTASFIEVAMPSGVSSVGDAFELIFRSGVRLRVPPRFDAAGLRRLVEALEAR